MIEYIPFYINILFILTTLLTLMLFYRASGNSAKVIWISVIWLIMQALISLTGFYKVTSAVPPRFLIAVLPPLLMIAFLFFTKKGRGFSNGLDLRIIVYLQVVRIPVEIVLYLLSIYKLVPEVMTFEGRNFDIVAGITAPLIAYFGFTKKIIGRKLIIGWNILCLALLLNIMTIAILSAPFTFQTMSFEQPNLAVFVFPFVWLPGYIVPVALMSHLLLFYRYRDLPE